MEGLTPRVGVSNTHVGVSVTLVGVSNTHVGVSVTRVGVSNTHVGVSVTRVGQVGRAARGGAHAESGRDALRSPDAGVPPRTRALGPHTPGLVQPYTHPEESESLFN